MLLKYLKHRYIAIPALIVIYSIFWIHIIFDYLRYPYVVGFNYDSIPMLFIGFLSISTVALLTSDYLKFKNIDHDNFS